MPAESATGGQELDAAQQDILFRLNRGGAELQSEAGVLMFPVPIRCVFEPHPGGKGRNRERKQHQGAEGRSLPPGEVFRLCPSEPWLERAGGWKVTVLRTGKAMAPCLEMPRGLRAAKRTQRWPTGRRQDQSERGSRKKTERFVNFS